MLSHIGYLDYFYDNPKNVVDIYRDIQGRTPQGHCRGPFFTINKFVN